jgi:hypothetical protein
MGSERDGAGIEDRNNHCKNRNHSYSRPLPHQNVITRLRKHIKTTMKNRF